ncbi:hypothetical protein AALP_AA2G028900 [Arabis alpina]|uniref:Uncharacterized protein n=1 Tax=Arabis alpina TaxID=50452 RepID=A0A087HEY9_ARAAL|nr:hypothetical protein AALP_AA2G028900 [Arabis alpina]
MAMSKNLKMILSLALIVFMALAATKTEAIRYIHYGDLNFGDHSLRCDKRFPQTCKKHEANPYQRGCETIERCRRHVGN